jgi:beta-aspartyl-peptidase (threonine type)
VQLDSHHGQTTFGAGCRLWEHIANPIRARKVLSESPHVYFVAEGAERFAQEHGISSAETKT